MKFFFEANLLIILLIDFALCMVLLRKRPNQSNLNSLCDVDVRTADPKQLLLRRVKITVFQSKDGLTAKVKFVL